MDPATRASDGGRATSLVLLTGVVFLLAALAGTSFLADDGNAADVERSTADGGTTTGTEHYLSTTPRSGVRSRVYDRLAEVSVRDVAGAYLVNASMGTVLVSTGSAATDPGGNRPQSNLASPLAQATNGSDRVDGSRPVGRSDGTPAVLSAATPVRNGQYVAAVDRAALSTQFGDDRNRTPSTPNGGPR